MSPRHCFIIVRCLGSINPDGSTFELVDTHKYLTAQQRNDFPVTSAMFKALDVAKYLASNNQGLGPVEVGVRTNGTFDETWLYSVSGTVITRISDEKE